MLLLKMGPEVPSRAQRALPALRRSEKEGGRRPPELSRSIKNTLFFYCNESLKRALQRDRFFQQTGRTVSS